MKIIETLLENPKMRRLLVFIFDFFSIGLALLLSYLIRFDFTIPPEQQKNLLTTLPYAYVIQSLAFIWFGLYRGVWAFASIKDLFRICKATLTATAFTALAIGLQNPGFSFGGWSRSIFILDGFFLILILGGGRFTYRLFRESFFSFVGFQKNGFQKKEKKSVLIIGAGQSASLIARELTQRSDFFNAFSIKIAGFLDDDKRLKGTHIFGAPVLGTIKGLEKTIQNLGPDEVIIAIPSLTGVRVKEILETTRKYKIPCRICPPIRDVLLGKVKLNQLREVQVEDLLRREVSKTEISSLDPLIKNKTILVTGGAGSIGSELCRQILTHSPKTLIIFDQSEFNLYRFQLELNQKYQEELAKIQVHFLIGDILDKKRVNEVLKQFNPETVLHAAAYKHVPLMESNLYEAIKNNVIGTYHLATLSAQLGVKNFILISTDKAVRPTNIMGATKRMAEIVTHAIGEETGMITSAVRFGNVLDSEGSVLPLFKTQIANNGPVTVTHPEVTRYFMTIPEAAQLVLHASVLSKGGEVFLLDMGEPVLIKDLAEELIKLSGLKPHEDIEIIYTGLRPGEKLFEELLFDEKSTEPTAHPKIVCAKNESFNQLEKNWKARCEDFSSHLVDTESLLEWLKLWVPGYQNKDLKVKVTNPTQRTLH